MDNQPREKSAPRSRFPDGFRILQGKREYVTYIERSSVRVWYSEEPYHYENHFHSAVEIIVPLKGEVVYTLPDGQYRVQADEALIVPPNCAHDLTMETGSSRYLLLFEPNGIFTMRDMQMIDELTQIPTYLTPDLPHTKTVRELLLKTVECYEKKEPLWNSRCYAYLLEMYTHVGRYYLEHSLHGETTTTLRMDSEIVSSALDYIDENYMLDISLEDVAAFSGFSKYYFSRVFKQQLGTSFSEYLRRKRVSVAEDKLIHSTLSVQSIAEAAGFGSIATFNRVFKDAKNLTPSRYREIYADFL